jgi:hypothetical protein
MRIELVGGPMDGQFVEVEFAPYEWRIAGKPADFYRNMLATPNSVPTHIKLFEGIYKRRGARGTLYDWQGWS